MPACRTLDCVTVFTRTLNLARRTVAELSGPDGRDPLARAFRGPWCPTPAGSDGRGPRVAVPLPSQLQDLADGWADAFATAVERLRLTGAEIVPIDIQPMLDAAVLLYGGAFVAERYVAVGAHIRAHTDLIGTDLDPTVAQIILDAAMPTAANYFADRERLDFLAARAAEAMSGLNALLTPTTTAHPTIAEVQADPVAVNSRLGRYTSFANLLDMASLAIPAGTAGGLPFGVMFTGPAGSDDRLAQIAVRCGQAPVDLLELHVHEPSRYRTRPSRPKLPPVG